MSGDVERPLAETMSLDDGRPTVLVAADQPAVVDGFAHWLVAEYDVLSAYGGGEAIDRLSATVDAAVLDRRMSGTTGDAVLSEIRERNLDCGVVFRTATEPSAPAEAAFDDYLVSPADSASLRAAVDGVVGDASGGRTASGFSLGRPQVGGSESRVGAVNELVREVGCALAETGTRAELERAACERLVGVGTYTLAWVGRCTATTDRLTLQTAAGLDGLREPESPAMLGDVPPPVERAATSGEVRTGSYDPPGSESLAALDDALDNAFDDAPDDTFDDALTEHFVETGVAGGSLAAVPLAHGETMYGLVVVHSPAEFTEAEVAALADLGSMLGYGISTVECRKLLVADTSVELELRLDDRADPLVDLAASLDCDLRLAGLVPADGGAVLCYLDADGAHPDDVFAAADDRAEVVRSVSTREDGGTFELRLDSASILRTLLTSGAVVDGLSVTDGTATVTAEVAPDADVRAVVEALRAAFDGADLLAQRQVSSSVASRSRFRTALADELTDQQRAALEAAYAADYFEWPRGTTAEELADSMGIASPTLHQHLRAAKRKLLDAYFDEAGGPPQEKDR